MAFSIASPAQAAPSCTAERASRLAGSASTRGRLCASSRHASREKIREAGVAARLTWLSAACDRASIPVRAATRGGCVSVRVTSRIATRNAARLSPQAIFSPEAASVMSANDCVSLPVPAVVGTAIDGSIGPVALPRP